MTRAPDPERPPWLARVAREDELTYPGAGLLAGDRHVITCAHVVASVRVRAGDLPAEPPDARMDVRFQFCGNEPVPAVVAPGGWFPEADLAVLELLGEPPAAALPAPLRSAAGPMRGHEFTAHGYPAGYDWEAVPSTGIVEAITGEGWLALRATSGQGIGLEAGFSGTPVYDHATGGVVGMVVRQALPRGADPRAGYAITADDLAARWPALEPLLRRPLTGDDRARVEALTGPALTSDGELPRIRDVDVYAIGVKPQHHGNAPGLPPYVPRRQVDEELAAALADPFLVAVGPAAAGKSRSLIELLRREMPDAAVIVPKPGPGTVNQLSGLTFPLPAQGAVLWLESLDEFVNLQSLDDGTLQRLAAHHPPITVVATLRTNEYLQLLRRTDYVGRTAVAILRRVERPVDVPTALAPEDRPRAAELYPADDFTDRGVGEVLVGAHQLELLCRHPGAESEEGWAVLRAAVDWRRMGPQAPIEEQMLRRLATAYLAEALPNADPDTAFGAGLAWALSELDGKVYPLTRVTAPGGGRAYRPNDYVVALAGGDRDLIPVRPVPAAAWELAVAGAPDGDLLALTYTAFVKGHADVVRAAAARARGLAGEPVIHAWATVLLGAVEALQGRYGPARELLEEALRSDVAEVVKIATTELVGLLLTVGEMKRSAELLEALFGDPDAAPGPQETYQLATLRLRQGRLDDAMRLLSEVVEAADRQATPLAEAQLGEIELRRQTVARAQQHGKTAAPVAGLLRGERQNIFQSLRSAGEALAPPLARTLLGNLYLGQGDVPRAREMLASAEETQDPRIVPLVAATRGALALAEEDFAAARELLRQAVESGHPGAAPQAKLSLAELAYREGDEDRARELLDELIDEGHPDHGTRAAGLLGNLLANKGDAAGAEGQYRRVIDSENAYWGDMAKIDLAVLLAQHHADRIIEAADLLREVMGGGHPDHAPRAADLLGDLLAAQGDDAGAEAAYRRAIASDNAYWAPMATLDLAALLSRLPEPPLRYIRSLLEPLVGAAEPDHGARAAEMLGELLAEAGDPEGAERAYREAIGREHSYWSPLAQIGLAITRLEGGGDGGSAEGRDGGVLDLLAAAAGADDAQISAVARLRRAGVLLAAGRAAEAEAEYAAVADSPLPQFAALALVEQAKLAVREGDVDLAAARLDTLRERLGPLTTPVYRTLERGLPDGPEFAYLRGCDFLHDANEMDTARELLQELIDSPVAARRPELRSAVQARLGRIRYMARDFEQARRLLWQALAADVPYVTPMAQLFLASLLMRQDRLSAATEIITPLAREGDAEYRPLALALLGRMKGARGEVEEGRRLLRLALALMEEAGERDTEEVRESLALLDSVRQAPPDRDRPAAAPTAPPDEPAALVAPALVSADAPAPPSAGTDGAPAASAEAGSDPGEPASGELPARVKLLLGEMASAEGAAEEAAAWLDDVIAAPDAGIQARARLALATLHFEQGDLDRAAELIRPLIIASGEELSEQVWTLLPKITDARAIRLRAERYPPATDR